MKRYYISLVFLLALCAAFCARGEVIINEILTSNGIYENGRSDDWLELYNPTDSAVDLSGMYLSNDPDDLQKWQFPGGSTLKAGAYVVIYCTGGENPGSGKPYTNFKLSSGGGEIVLSGNGSDVHFVYPEQFGNFSYGYIFGQDYAAFMEERTPGAKNLSAGCFDRTFPPELSVQPGMYSKGLTVELTTDESGARIYYTTDCSTPTKASKQYTSPISVTSTTIIRAVAIKDGMLPSTVTGGTYIIESGSFEVPIVSVYTDDDYLYSTKYGIMVKGSGKVANYNNESLIHPAQIEYFDENGIERISQMVSIKISGHSSRNLKQKSMTILSESAFGKDSFDWAFFENRPYDSYKTLLIRNTSSDYHSARMRDAVLGELSEGLGLYYSAGRPVVVYLNGEYFGHMNLREKWNKYSIAQWEGITSSKAIDDVVILEGTGLGKNYVLAGDGSEWAELMSFCRTADMKDPENVKHITDMIDVKSMFDHVIVTSLIDNIDIGNVRIYKFPGGKYKYMLHDIESSALNTDPTPVDMYTKSRNGDSTVYPRWPFVALMEVPEYQDMFLKELAYVIENNFLYWNQVEPVWQKWINAIEPLLDRHYKKFGTSKSKSQWRTDTRAAMYYVRLRPSAVIEYYCDWLNVSGSKKQEYFGETMKLLEKYNGLKAPTE